MHVQHRNNAWYLRENKWDKEAKERITKSIYLGTNAYAARELAAKYTDDPEILNRICAPKSQFEHEVESSLEAISGLLIDKNYMPVVKNGAIRTILSNAYRQLAQLAEFGDEELPETLICQICQMRHNQKCLKFNKPFSRKDESALCPHYKAGQVSNHHKEVSNTHEQKKGILLFGEE